MKMVTNWRPTYYGALFWALKYTKNKRNWKQFVYKTYVQIIPEIEKKPCAGSVLDCRYN